MTKLKIAVTGKGGVGKTTVVAGLARSFAKAGNRVIALDVDPSPNLLSALGSVTDVRTVKPLMEMRNLIEERTGIPSQGYSLVFKLNPKVDDILEKFGIKCKDGVELLVVGEIKQGGEGCFCPANALARRLVDHLAEAGDILIMDMEAGVEHLGRGTTRGMEILLIVVEPSLRSVETAGRIKKLSDDFAVEKVLAVINKVKSEEEEKVISNRLRYLGIPVVYTIPYDTAIAKADMEGVSIFDIKEGEQMFERMKELSKILETKKSSPFKKEYEHFNSFKT